MHVLSGATALAEELLAKRDGIILDFFRRRLQVAFLAQHIDLALTGGFHAVHPEERLIDGFADR